MDTPRIGGDALLSNEQPAAEPQGAAGVSGPTDGVGVAAEPSGGMLGATVGSAVGGRLVGGSVGRLVGGSGGAGGGGRGGECGAVVRGAGGWWDRWAQGSGRRTAESSAVEWVPVTACPSVSQWASV